MTKRKAKADINQNKAVDDCDAYIVGSIKKHTEFDAIELIAYETSWRGYSDDDNTMSSQCEFFDISKIVSYWLRLKKPMTAQETAVFDALRMISNLEQSWIRLFSSMADLKAIGKLPFWKFMRESSGSKNDKEYSAYVSRYQAQFNKQVQLHRYPLLMIEISQTPQPWEPTKSANGGIRAPPDERPVYPTLPPLSSLLPNESCTLPDIKPNVEGSTALFPSSGNRYRQTIQIGWSKFGYYLQVGDTTKDGVEILEIHGEVQDYNEVEVADIMKKYGPVVAAKAFIRLPNNKCLDRRYKYDLSILLCHSCSPNCEIVYSDEEEPRLVLVAKSVIDPGEPLTVNYFPSMPSKYNNYEASMKAHVEFISHPYFPRHIMCTCSNPSCQGFIWCDEESLVQPPPQKKRKTTKRASKSKKKVKQGDTTAQDSPEPAKAFQFPGIEIF